MRAEEIVVLIEDGWEELACELGDDSEDFLRGFHRIVEPLGSAPTEREVENAVDAICDLLDQHQGGRKLLGASQSLQRERLLGTPSDTLSTQEATPAQVANRLKKLSERKEQKAENKK